MSTVTSWSGTGWGRRHGRFAQLAWTATWTPPWPSWPAGTWPVMARPPTGTSPSGPGCRCATPAGGWRRSPASWISAPTAGLDLAGRRAAEVLPPPRLLGSFDPVLHGWASREPILGPHQGIVTVNGIFRPFALVDGRAVATWTLSDGRVAIQPLVPLAAPEAAALDADAADVKRFLGVG